MQDILVVSDCPTVGHQFRDALTELHANGVHVRTAGVANAAALLPYANFVVLAHRHLDQPTREFVDSCQADAPDAPLIVAALPRDEFLVVEYLMLGAAGYVFAEDPPEALGRAIEAASRGHLIVDPTTATAIVRQIADLRDQLQGTGHYRFDGRAHEVLTAREQEVLTLIVSEDFSNGEIAERLTIETGTVKNHVHKILKKLGVHSRDQAVKFYSDSVVDPAT